MTDHDRTGWFNYCPQCQQRYWVRASDLGNSKMRRFTGPESDERHECAAQAVRAELLGAS